MATKIPKIRDVANSTSSAKAKETQATKGRASETHGTTTVTQKTKAKAPQAKRAWMPSMRIEREPRPVMLEPAQPPPPKKSHPTRAKGTRTPTIKVPKQQKPPSKEDSRTQVPKTEAPKTQATKTRDPGTSVSTTHIPESQSLTTKRPVTQPPIAHIPAKQPPIAQMSTTRIPAIQITPTRESTTRGYQFKDDYINCPICTKHYDQPRILPCLHTFCHNCLEKYIQDGKYDIGTKGFPCPCCHKDATTPELTKTRPEKWAELFPINSLLADLVDLHSLRTGTKLCDPCRKNRSKSDVHSYCKNCRNAMCEACAKTHRGLNTCKNHIVITLAQFEAAISSLKVEEEFCTKHEGKTMKHFCQSHSKLCCSSCISEEHRHCSNVISVAEVAKKCREAHEIPKLENALAKYKEHLEIILMNRSSQLKRLENKKAKMIEEFLNVKTQAISQLEQMESDFKTKLEQTHKQETKKIHRDVERCKEIQSGVINASELLEIAKKHGSDSQIVDIVEKVRHECRYYEEQIGAINTKLRNKDYDLELDRSLEQMLKKLNQFGKINVKTSPSGLPEAPKLIGTLGIQRSKTQTKTVNPGFALSDKEASELGEFNAKSDDEPEDITCWFTGAQFLKDGRILLADRTNRKLKVFTRHFEAASELVLSSRPWDVTVISDREIAVSLPDECKIQFVFVSQTIMSTIRTISTGEPCYGIHYTNGKIIIITYTYDGDPPILKILSPQGEELTYIKSDEDGYTLFSRPYYVASTNDGSEIFVSDERQGCVANLTEDGELNFTYSALDLGHAAGIALDDNGNIYVCGTTSNSVHVLNSKGDRVNVLVTGENISCPRAISFEPKEKKLLVTQGDKDVVKVYSLA